MQWQTSFLVEMLERSEFHHVKDGPQPSVSCKELSIQKKVGLPEGSLAGALGRLDDKNWKSAQPFSQVKAHPRLGA